MTRISKDDDATISNGGISRGRYTRLAAAAALQGQTAPELVRALTDRYIDGVTDDEVERGLKIIQAEEAAATAPQTVPNKGAEQSL